MVRSRRSNPEIAPEEIFLDSSNLPAHETSQFEGRVEHPVSARSLFGVSVVFFIIVFIFVGRAYSLQISGGASYAEISKNNSLASWPIFAERGLITDRTGKFLAWNEVSLASDASSSDSLSITTPFALRKYIPDSGFSILLGFLRYPKADSTGSWWRTEYSGIAGIEFEFNQVLSGVNGSRMVERDAHHNIVRQNITTPPQNGADLHLSIDEDIQTHLYQILSQHAASNGFKGGAAIIMDVHTGQVLAITSFPEYSDQAFTDGDSAEITAAVNNPQTPMLDRAVSGQYTPGSIVKTIFASAALNEGIISPDKEILSIGAITLPNPYDPLHPSVFKDWTAHGLIDMRTAIAVSSDEYFYTIGGGYGGQQGLGISRIDEYAKKFGLGTTTGILLPGEQGGIIPSPAWKAIAFPNDPTWRIGDTYHTAIGQYGFQITPIQAVDYIAAIANGGTLLVPQIIASSSPVGRPLGIPDSYLQIVRDGMRLAVTSTRRDATVKALNIPGIDIAAKTGTAQLGTHNQWENSWSVGFWPATNPKYAYAVVLENAPDGTLLGAAPGMNPFFYWLMANHPEYVN